MHSHLISIIAIYNLEACSIDIVAAFLSADIDAEVWVTQPNGYANDYPDGHAIKAKKTIYGLKQSNRLFNLKLL